MQAHKWKKNERLKIQCTWTFHTVTQIRGNIINNVSQEGEICNIVSMDVIWIRCDLLQFIFICIFNTLQEKKKTKPVTNYAHKAQ